MKIGIDISSIVYGTGVSSYTRNLVLALIKHKDVDFVLFGSSLRRKHKLDDFVQEIQKTKARNVSAKIFWLPPSFLSFLWNSLHKVSIEKFIGKVDIFHSSDWMQPPSYGLKVTTIHDLAPLRIPHLCDPKVVSTHKKRLFWVAKEVDKIITDSAFTKKEAVDLLSLDPKRIEVIPPAADPEILPVSCWKVTQTLKKFGIRTQYFLMVGTDPRKNIEGARQALKMLTTSSSKFKLVVVGRPWRDVSASDVMFLGYVSKEDLAALYSGATALLYVSFYEGFGLPILEAMKLGCPVVTSCVSSMPEVAGDAAVLVDPYNPESIAWGIKQVLFYSQDLIRKGKLRAKEFSWKYTSELMMRVYNKLLR